MSPRLPILAAIGVLTAALPAFADDIDDAIKARQGYYQMLSANAGALFGMAKGEVAYDAAQASTHAQNLELLSQLNNSALWPAGSSNADRPGKTRALPVIWSTFPAIGEKAQAFNGAAATLAATAGGGLDSLRANIGALGASCKGCHDTYRAKTF